MGHDVKKTISILLYYNLTKCHELNIFFNEKEIQNGDIIIFRLKGDEICDIIVIMKK